MGHRILLAVLLTGLPAIAQAPASTDFQVRLKTEISTVKSRAGDPVEAVCIAPGAGIPAGTVVRGTVEKVTAATQPTERAALLLHFIRIESGQDGMDISAHVIDVDNSRETVDEQGQINGILASETLTGKMDQGIEKLNDKYSGLAGFLGAVKSIVFDSASTAIDYGPGVELTLRLSKPIGKLAWTPENTTPPVIDESGALAELISKLPFQTVAQSPPKPSDVTNIVLLGTEDSVRKAFAAAGWTVAAKLNPLAKFQTVRAIAEDRGYNEAPVSILMLDGKPPDIVFEKTNNTFAKRHHLRVWRRPESFRGSAVWAVAATHDTGIDFSDRDRTFIHRIDSQIDNERDKVLNDLCLTRQVRALQWVDRTAVPRKSNNATGDSIETDARAAVLLLQ